MLILAQTALSNSKNSLKISPMNSEVMTLPGMNTIMKRFVRMTRIGYALRVNAPAVWHVILGSAHARKVTCTIASRNICRLGSLSGIILIAQRLVHHKSNQIVPQSVNTQTVVPKEVSLHAGLKSAMTDAAPITVQFGTSKTVNGSVNSVKKNLNFRKSIQKKPSTLSTCSMINTTKLFRVLQKPFAMKSPKTTKNA